MKIISLSVKSNFKYLWLKTVVDIDLNVHCAKCLIGEYNSAIKKDVKEYKNISLEKDKIHYLCGVAFPFNYNKNFHLAFKYKENSIINYSNNGIDITIENAEILPIDEKFIDKEHINSNKKSFYTCRNWQFANYFKDNLR